MAVLLFWTSQYSIGTCYLESEAGGKVGVKRSGLGPERCGSDSTLGDGDGTEHHGDYQI